MGKLLDKIKSGASSVKQGLREKAAEKAAAERAKRDEDEAYRKKVRKQERFRTIRAEERAAANADRKKIRERQAKTSRGLDLPDSFNPFGFDINRPQSRTAYRDVSGRGAPAAPEPPSTSVNIPPMLDIFPKDMRDRRTKP